MFNEHGIKHIDLDITDSCNLACKYCYHGSQNNIKTRLEDDVKEKLKEIFANEQPVVHFFGGEPLTNFNNLKDLVEGAKIQRWGATSNITLLDDSKTEFFIKNRGNIHVSIDGNEKAHNMQRVYKGNKGSYKRVSENVPNALKITASDTARMTVQPEIAHLVYDSVLSIKELGFRSVAPMPVLEAQWSPRQWKSYDKCLERLSYWNIANPNFMIKNFSDTIRGIFRPQVRKRNCGAGWGLVAVSTDGEITPCHRFSDRTDKSYSGEDVKEYSLGNVKTGGIDSQKLKKWRDNFGDLPEQCKGCEVVFSCSGACPNVAARMNGNPNSIVPAHCNYMKLSAPHARKMLVYFMDNSIDNIYQRMHDPNYVRK